MRILLGLLLLGCFLVEAKKDYSIKIKSKVAGSPTMLELKSGSDAGESMVNYHFTNDGNGALRLTGQQGEDGKQSPVLSVIGMQKPASFLEVSAVNATNATEAPAAAPSAAAAADPAERSEQEEKDENAALPPKQEGTRTIVNGKTKVVGKGGKSTSLMTTSSINVGGVSQWVLLSSDDMNEINGWVRPNGKKIQEGVSCSSGGDDGSADNFLGPRFGPSADCSASFFSASKTFTLPEHTEVMVTGRYHFIDQWQGTMHGFAKADGVKRWVKQYEYCTKMFSAFCREYSISVCGDERYPEKLSERFAFSYPHTKPTLKLEVGMDTMSGTPPTCSQVKSWGVDDVSIWIKRG